MYKVLIVDDFSVDRENLRELITSHPFFASLQIVAECENGAEALELASILEPDIVISDIEMPVMNGFEMARSLRVQFPKIKIIFCTLYNEFQYVKKALYLGSYGYVLKPVEPGDLKEGLLKVTDTLEQEKEQELKQQELFNQFSLHRPQLINSLLKELMYGIAHDQDDILNMLKLLGLVLNGGFYRLSLLEIDDFPMLSEGRSIIDIQFILLKVQQRLLEMMDGNSVLVKIDDSHFAILHHFKDSVSESEASVIVHQAVTQVVESFSKTDLTISAAISDEVRQLTYLHRLYEQCLYILRLKFTLGKAKVLYGKDIPSSSSGPLINFNTIEKDVRFLIYSSDISEIEPYVEGLFGQASHHASASTVKSLCVYLMICLQNIWMGDKDLPAGEEKWSLVAALERLLAMETVFEVKQEVIQAFQQANERFRQRENSRNKQSVDKIRHYVETHCHMAVSLDLLSEQFHYSPNYLNHIFKQETGLTVFDYLTQCRMEKAKQLLEDSEKKLYEIAEAVGYTHTAYFSNLFKKHTGLTPTDYRRRLS